MQRWMQRSGQSSRVRVLGLVPAAGGMVPYAEPSSWLQLSELLVRCKTASGSASTNTCSITRQRRCD
jgi:hypothetical protein